MTATRDGLHTGEAEWKFVIIVPFAAIFSRFGVNIPPSEHGHSGEASVVKGLTDKSPYPKSSASSSKMLGGLRVRFDATCDDEDDDDDDTEAGAVNVSAPRKDTVPFAGADSNTDVVEVDWFVAIPLPNDEVSDEPNRAATVVPPSYVYG
jgi:hypothetical protein